MTLSLVRYKKPCFESWFTPGHSPCPDWMLLKGCSCPWWMSYSESLHCLMGCLMAELWWKQCHHEQHSTAQEESSRWLIQHSGDHASSITLTMGARREEREWVWWIAHHVTLREWISKAQFWLGRGSGCTHLFRRHLDVSITLHACKIQAVKHANKPALLITVHHLQLLLTFGCNPRCATALWRSKMKSIQLLSFGHKQNPEEPEFRMKLAIEIDIPTPASIYWARITTQCTRTTKHQFELGFSCTYGWQIDLNTIYSGIFNNSSGCVHTSN